ncbi:Frataxin-like domain-containing protein [Hypoxylon sp. FL0543]|nr:Frataxin-like domain-containing protein [Hypoxylon sp. FL0543]
MTRATLAKLGRATTSRIAARRAAVSRTGRHAFSIPARPVPLQFISTRPFSTTLRLSMPSSFQGAKRADITMAQYHDLADEYLDTVLAKFEEKQDEQGEIDVEYSSGVMTVKIPKLGVYIVNKQPPNKQIWLSSPVSGPKRFDYVIYSDGQDQKQDSGMGDWVCIRDGEKLTDILSRETGVVLDDPSAVRG